MPVSGCVIGCTYRFSKDSSDIKIYCFPEEWGRRQLWIKALSCAKWELKDRHLCKEHFVLGRPTKDSEDNDYATTIFKGGQRRHVTTKTPGREERAMRAESAKEL